MRHIQRWKIFCKLSFKKLIKLCGHGISADVMTIERSQISRIAFVVISLCLGFSAFIPGVSTIVIPSFKKGIFPGRNIRTFSISFAFISSAVYL